MNKRRNVIKAAAFLLGLFTLLQIMSFAFHREKNMDVYDMKAVEAKRIEIDAETDNTLDVLFLGDSECYSSFSPLNLWSEYGITSYVCGTSAQRLCDSYAILEDAFCTQSPKVIVLETNCLYRNPVCENQDKDSVMRFLTKRMSVFAYHSDWKRFAGKFVASEKRAETKNNLKGFVVRRSVNPYRGGEYMQETEDVKEFPEESYRYLEQISELCRENHAVLLLVSTPSPKNWNYERHNGVSAWAKEHGTDYVDLNLEKNILIDWDTDTKDGGDHLNLAGAKKVTHFLGGYLGERYSLSDLRENPEYQDWMDCCAASADDVDLKK